MSVIDNLRKINSELPASFAPKLNARERAVAEALDLDVIAKVEPEAKPAYKLRHTSHAEDAIAQAFMELGEAAAKNLEELGAKAYEDGCRRQKELNAAAASVRAKSQFQADSAIDHVKWVSSLEPKKNLPPTTSNSES